jgi:hypothetical protein
MEMTIRQTIWQSRDRANDVDFIKELLIRSATEKMLQSVTDTVEINIPLLIPT